MSWRHIEDKDRKARKPHRCIVCDELINPGEIYRSRSGYGDDGIVTITLHSECEEASRKWSQDQWDSHEPGEFDRPARGSDCPGENDRLIKS
jgi:hypothetical protein